MKTVHERTAIEELTTNVLEARFENFNEAILENTKNRIIDTVGCLIAGANAPGNIALVDLVKNWGGKKEATILVHGVKSQAHNVAMVNSIMARSFDSEPIGGLLFGKPLPSHISGTTVMTAITMAEMTHANGKELITAMLAGEDVTCRVLAAAPSWTHVDNTGTVNVFGATAIAGRLLGLNEFQMKNAFGIALHHLAGSYQSVWDGTFAFKLSQGVSARGGIFSAQLAKGGWIAAEDPLLGRFAYYHLYTEGLPNTEILMRDLGKKYYAETQFKPFPSCRYNHGPIECALKLVQKHHLKVEDIKEVIVYVSRRGLEATTGRPFRIGDFPYANALFSYQYTVANALLRKSVLPNHFSEESIRDPELNALIAKIRLAELPTRDEEILSAKLEVNMNDGRKLYGFTDAPKGDQVKNPMTKDEIIAKFWTNVEYSKTVTRKNSEKVLNLLKKLEELGSLSKIVKLLVA